MNNINIEIEEKLINYILQKKTKTINLSEIYKKLKFHIHQYLNSFKIVNCRRFVYGK